MECNAFQIFVVKLIKKSFLVRTANQQFKNQVFTILKKTKVQTATTNETKLIYFSVHLSFPTLFIGQVWAKYF